MRSHLLTDPLEPMCDLRARTGEVRVELPSGPRRCEPRPDPS
jgi:hypothetical protein